MAWPQRLCLGGLGLGPSWAGGQTGGQGPEADADVNTEEPEGPGEEGTPGAEGVPKEGPGPRDLGWTSTSVAASGTRPCCSKSGTLCFFLARCRCSSARSLTRWSFAVVLLASSFDTRPKANLLLSEPVGRGAFEGCLGTSVASGDRVTFARVTREVLRLGLSSRLRPVLCGGGVLGLGLGGAGTGSAWCWLSLLGAGGVPAQETWVVTWGWEYWW